MTDQGQERELTAEEFERAYAARSGWTLERLREYRTVRPCACGQDGCEGWQSLSHERAEEYDQNEAEGTLPPQLW